MHVIFYSKTTASFKFCFKRTSAPVGLFGRFSMYILFDLKGGIFIVDKNFLL